MSNSYYNHSAYPAPNAPGSSAALRAELDRVAAGFNKLPTLAGNGYKVAMIASDGLSLIASSALQALTITGSTINSTPIGGSSPSTGVFTTLTVNSGITGNITGNVTGNVTGNLTGNVTSSGSSSFTSLIVSGGTLNNVVIGGVTPNAITGTVITATSGFAGNLTGNVSGNVTGNLTGNVTGNVTGDVTGTLNGNVSTGSGTSTFNNVTINGTLDMNSGSTGTITGLSTPTNDSDAATKGYVDSLAQGLDVKASVKAATTANIGSLSGTKTIDGVSVVAGDRVLLKNQGDPTENGIYVVAAGSWSRSTDANTWGSLVSAFTFVEDGSVNADTGWTCTVNAGGSIGSNAITWAQFSGAGSVSAGNGLDRSGTTLFVKTVSSSRITVGSGGVDLAASGVTASTYKSVTVDSYGRVTAGTNPTTLSGYGITDAYTKAEVDAIVGSTTSAAASAAAAATSATNAAASASSASTSASAASTSAAAAAASYDSFDDRYLGAKSSDPTVDNDGNALLTGALYWNTSANKMRAYTGSAWVDTGSAVNGTSARAVYTATGGQTDFAITYDLGFVDVWYNGSKLVAGVEFLATDGAKIVLVTPATAGATVDIIAYGSFSLANTYTQTQTDSLLAAKLSLSGGTMSGAITFASSQTYPQRVVAIADATSITVNADTTDIATQANTQAAGTLTINAPTGTPTNGQKIMVRVSCTNAQTLSFNAAFVGSTDVSLPTATTGSSKFDYMGFIYNSTTSKWHLIAKNFGF